MRFLLVLLALASASAYAEQAAVNDPQYQPNAGTIFGDTSYQISKAQIGTVSTNGNTISQLVGYAPTDKLSFTANVSQVNIEKSEGLSDIVLGAKYRLKNDDHRLDLLGSVSISPEDKETESDGDSNANSGGHAVALGAEYGHRTSARTWSLFGLLGYNLTATEKDKTAADTKVEQDPFFDLNLGAKLYTVLGENCGIKSTLGVKFAEEHDDDSSPKNTTRGSTIFNVGSEYQHVLSPSLYLRGGFVSQLSGNDDGLVTMLYQVGAGYQF